MCVRYASARRDAEIVGEEAEPSWNVAPQQDIRVVLERAPREAPEASAVVDILVAPAARAMKERGCT